MIVNTFSDTMNIFFKILIVTIIHCFFADNIYAKNNLLSYQSEYSINLFESGETRIPGKTYVDEASGNLYVDWINNCNNSWISNQRMVTRFVNSHGVGTLSEINYSVNESTDGQKMDFVLEIKENAELIDRTIGKAEKNDELTVNLRDKKTITFSNDVIFPHKFLEKIIDNFQSQKKMIIGNVYEGTIPDKYFKISVFFTDEIVRESKKIIPKGVVNKFKKIRMAYYKDNIQTPIFEQTVHLNEQGIASFFKYDYPDYSLLLNLEKIDLTSLSCE